MNSQEAEEMSSIIENFDPETAVNALFMLYCTSLLPLVILGIAFFYSGLTQRRSSLTMLGLPILMTPLVLIDWFIWGYSLCYGTARNQFIGSLKFVVLRHLRDPAEAIYQTPRGEILSFNHFIFNGMMKAICTALTFPGCIAERGRVVPMLVFLFFWSCIIYDPVTYWFWNKNGWLSAQLDKLPVLDFAGGSPIHIVSGFTALAYSYILGPRNPKILYNYRNTNTGWIMIGTFITLCGWNGFIAGCDYKFSVTSGYIIINTILCGCVSGIVWLSIDFYWSSIPLEEEEDFESQKAEVDVINSRNTANTSGGVAPDEFIRRVDEPNTINNNILKPRVSTTGVSINQHAHLHTIAHVPSKKVKKYRRKFSLISFCSGVMTGLVVITPAGGYVSSGIEFWKSFTFGIVGAIIANIATRLKYYVNIDDALDIFAIHGVAGMVGSILTGVFATSRYGSEGGWVENNWKQIGYQILGCVVTAAYVFVMTCVLLYIIDFIPSLHLRIDKDFNKRMRSRKKRLEENAADIEGQQMAPIEDTKESEGEALELLGSDNYEFNGEYLMDFMEFIKVLQPDDYDDDEILINEEMIDGRQVAHQNSSDMECGNSSDFKMHSNANEMYHRRE